MANSDTRSAWQQIQAGVYDTSELLNNQKYNLSMIRARQTLEIIVKQLSGREDFENQSLADIIDSLSTDNLISNISYQNFQKICAIGDRAVHEGNNEAFNATIAYKLLSEEVQSFIQEYSPKRTRFSPIVAPVKNDVPQKKQVSSNTETPQKRRTTKKPSKNKKPQNVNTQDLVKVIIGALILFILIFLFKSLNPLKKDKKADTNTTNTTVLDSENVDNSESSIEAVPETTASVKYITTARLHVRSSPSLDGDILATLSVGVSVEYAGEYDAKWSIINYNGGQAYVATEYIKPAQ
jgi:N-acetylmuramoyl-L-alanine amidase